MIVAVKIGLSPAELWSSAANGGGFLVHGFGKSVIKDTRTAANLLVSVEELKYRVVLVYGVMEALFSAWVCMGLWYARGSLADNGVSLRQVMTALYDEQVETGNNLAFRPGRVQETHPQR